LALLLFVIIVLELLLLLLLLKVLPEGWSDHLDQLLIQPLGHIFQDQAPQPRFQHDPQSLGWQHRLQPCLCKGPWGLLLLLLLLQEDVVVQRLVHFFPSVLDGFRDAGFRGRSSRGKSCRWNHGLCACRLSVCVGCVV